MQRKHPQPVNFCGRERELAILLRALPEQKILAIEGLGGIGKTALAQTLALRLSRTAEYKDLLWFTCPAGITGSGFRSEITRTASELALEIRKPELSAESLCRILEDHSIILFIDNAQHAPADALTDLIRASLSAFSEARLILISRERPGIPPELCADIFELKLSGLSAEETGRFIAGILGAHCREDLADPDKKAIFEKLHGHPYSLKLLISLLLSGQTLQNLMEEGSILDREWAIYLSGIIWKKLSGTDRKLLEKLSLLRKPVDPNIFLDKDSWAGKKLEDMLLFEHDRRGNVYLHELLKEFSAGTIEIERKKKLHAEIGIILSKCAAHEARNLQEAFFHFREAELFQEAVDCAIALGDLFFLLGEEIPDYLTILDQALTVCQNYRLPELQRCKVELLIFYERIPEAMELTGRLGDDETSIFLKGRVCFIREQYSEALKFYRLLEGRKISNDLKIRLLSDSGLCLARLGDIKAAESCFAKLDARTELEPDIRWTAILCCKADFLGKTGGIFQGLETLEKAEINCRKHGATGLLARVLYEKAKLLCLLDDWKLVSAQTILTESIKCFELIGNNIGLVYDLILQSEIYLRIGQAIKARRMIQKALNLTMKYDWIYETAQLCRILGRVYTISGRYPEAEIQFEKSLAGFGRIDFPLELCFVELDFARLKLVSGRLHETQSLLDRVRDFSGRLHLPELNSSYFLLSSLFHRCSGSQAFESCSQKYLESLSLLPEPARERFKKDAEWLLKTVETRGSKEFLLLSGNGTSEISSADREQHTGDRKKFELFADFEARLLEVDGTEINFFGKRMLVPLLYELCRNPGEAVRPEILFPAVWKRPYDPEHDDGQVRMAISRLREILLDKAGNRFICSSPEKGCYYFNPDCNFCIIRKI
ncbi:MAG: AAA family ATPase [Candidatus Wallbacteria bacterium]|nr:AAA family ATPase [Candidatus Wallbacteria bacterium]